MEPSTQLAHALADNSPDGLWVIDATGATVYANPRVAEILGRTPDEMAHLTLADASDETGRAMLPGHLADLAAGHPGRENVETMWLRGDGTPVWTLVSWRPLTGSDGAPLGWLHRLSEHTERKRLLDKVLDREQQLAAAQSLAHLGSWEWDAGADTIWWSDELYRIYGLDPAQFDATYDGFVDHLHPDDRPIVEAVVAEALAGKDSFRWEGRIVRPSGEQRWVRGLGVVERDDEGTPLRLHGTAQDITDMVRADQLAAEATRRLHLLQHMAEAANQSASLAEALEHAANALDGTEGWEPMCVLVRDGDGPLVSLSLPLEADTWLPEPDLELAERCWGSKQPEHAPAPGHETTHTIVAIPVTANNEVACVIELLANEVPPDERSQQLILQVADQLSRVAERERSAADLAA
ncbi:MAG: PAS domain-containing protein, partial [Nocardioides sp.]|nr:PAS domain-containing protein [Nocardioides sp.]